MALSIKAAPISLRCGAFTIAAVVVSFVQKGFFAIVEDLQGEGTEGVVNFRHFSSWSQQKGEAAPVCKETPGMWLQSRIGKVVKVAELGVKEVRQGKLTSAYEETGLGLFFDIETSEGSFTIQWSNVLFVRLRTPAASKPAAAKPVAASTDEDPSRTQIMSGSGNGDEDELGLMPEPTDNKKPI